MKRYFLLALVAAACSGSSTVPTVSGPAPSPEETIATTPPTTAPTPLTEFPEGPSALRDMNAEEFPPPLVDPSAILSGGPPPDGIPPLDDPTFVSVEDADAWLVDAEPVVVVHLGDDVRAYPVQILIWHEIVNDVVGGEPISVTYCPLCNSAVSYSRLIDGLETSFGTSGRLYASALVMYDRATESLWTHFDGTAVVGMLAGRRLDPIPSPLIAWSDFKVSFPDGKVLDRDSTGYSRPYGRNPYVGYDNPDERPFLFRGEVDARAVAMQRVIGVVMGETARAWTLEAISGGEARATNTILGETPLVILWKAGQASALETEEVTTGRDVGSVGVFSPEVDGVVLTFAAEGDAFVDAETGSRWDVTGRAISGELAGRLLERFHHLDTFWFAWSTYMPDTDLVTDAS